MTIPNYSQVEITWIAMHLVALVVATMKRSASVRSKWRLDSSFGIFHWVIPLRTAAPFPPASVVRQPSWKSLQFFCPNPRMVERLNRLQRRLHQQRHRIHYINRSSISTPKSSIPYTIRSTSHSRFVAHLLQDLCIYTWKINTRKISETKGHHITIGNSNSSRNCINF